MSSTRDGVVVVTGAAGALGSATSAAFAAAGYRVLGLDLAPEVVGSTFAGVTGVQVDLLDEEAVAAVFEAHVPTGPLRHVVQIAGGALAEEPGTQDDPSLLSTSTFRRSVELNLTTQYTVLRATLPWFRRSPGTDRSMTLTSSWNALSSQGMPAYSAAKAGLIGMMHALVRPLGQEAIRLNVVAPGTIRTPRTERIWEHEQGHFDRLARTAATGRLGTPDDVARTCLVLARDLTHVCGQVIVVDGGQSS